MCEKKGSYCFQIGRCGGALKTVPQRSLPLYFHCIHSHRQMQHFTQFIHLYTQIPSGHHNCKTHLATNSKPILRQLQNPILWQLQNPSCDNFKTQSCHKLKTLSCKAHSSLAPWTHTYLTFGTPGRIRQMPRTMQSIITPAIEASYNFSTMTCRWMIIQKNIRMLKDLGCSLTLPLIHKPYKPALTLCLWGYV